MLSFNYTINFLFCQERKSPTVLKKPRAESLLFDYAWVCISLYSCLPKSFTKRYNSGEIRWLNLP